MSQFVKSVNAEITADNHDRESAYLASNAQEIGRKGWFQRIQEYQLRERALACPRGLGVTAYPGLGHDKGRINVDLETNGLATLCGFRKGDQIISVNGHSVNNPIELARQMDCYSNGEFKIQIMRNGLPTEVPIIGYRSRAALGATAVNSGTVSLLVPKVGLPGLFHVDHPGGAIVRSVADFAQVIGLHPEDVIVRMIVNLHNPKINKGNGRIINIYSANDLQEAVKKIIPGYPVLVAVQRAGDPRPLSLGNAHLKPGKASEYMSPFLKASL